MTSWYGVRPSAWAAWGVRPAAAASRVEARHHLGEQLVDALPRQHLVLPGPEQPLEVPRRRCGVGGGHGAGPRLGGELGAEVPGRPRQLGRHLGHGVARQDVEDDDRRPAGQQGADGGEGLVGAEDVAPRLHGRRAVHEERQPEGERAPDDVVAGQCVGHRAGRLAGADVHHHPPAGAAERVGLDLVPPDQGYHHQHHGAHDGQDDAPAAAPSRRAAGRAGPSPAGAPGGGPGAVAVAAPSSPPGPAGVRRAGSPRVQPRLEQHGGRRAVDRAPPGRCRACPPRPAPPRPRPWSAARRRSPPAPRARLEQLAERLGLGPGGPGGGARAGRRGRPAAPPPGPRPPPRPPRRPRPGGPLRGRRRARCTGAGRPSCPRRR